MRVTAEVENDQLARLVKQVQAGDEVVLTQGHKPVAKIVSAIEIEARVIQDFKIHSFKGHRILALSPVSQSELADEMFGGK